MGLGFFEGISGVLKIWRRIVRGSILPIGDFWCLKGEGVIEFSFMRFCVVFSVGRTE